MKKPRPRWGRLQAQNNDAATAAKAALDEYVRQTRASQPKVVPQLAPAPSGTGFVAKAWSAYHRALNAAEQGIADATNAGIGALWATYTGTVDVVGRSAIGLGQGAANLGLKLTDLADNVGTRAVDLGVRVGVLGAQGAATAVATSAHLVVDVARKDAQKALQANEVLLAELEALIAKHRKDVEGASQFAGKQANPGISADQNMTVFEATLAYGPTYGETWTSLNFNTANFDWFGVLFTPLSDFCIALPTEPDVVKTPGQVLVGLAWGETENFMNIEGLPQVGADRHGAMTLPRASASISESQQAVLRQALALKGAANAPLVVASHFTVINYNSAGLQEELSFVPSDGPRSTFTADGFSAAGVLSPAGFNDANFGTCERNLKWYFENCASVPGRATRVDWHLSGHSHRSAVYSVKQGRDARGTDTVTVSTRRDPGMYKAKTVVAANSGTQFVVSSCGGPIGVQNLAGELNGMTLRPPAGSRLDCIERSIEQIKTQRTGRATGTRYNEVPRLAVALDYLYVLQSDKPPVGFLWEPRTGMLSKGRASTVKLRLSEQVKKLDCIGAVKVWVFEGGKNSAGDPVKNWHCLAPELASGKDGATLQFSTTDLEKLSRAMVTTPARPTVGGAASMARGVGAISMQRIAQAFCEIVLKKPTIAPYTEGPEKGKTMPDWSADMKWENDPWIFPLDIGTSQTGANSFDFMQRREGEHGQVPDWKFLAKYYAGKGYLSRGAVLEIKEEPSQPQ